jgi:YD repeat-containing protein
MLSKNMVSIPIETTTAIQKAGIGLLYSGEKVTEFAQLSNGDIKPSRILEQRFNQPIPSPTFYNGPGGSISQYKIPQTFTYDASGNLIGVKDEGSRNVSNIYDYNDKYIIATIINADPIVDKSAYTSFETLTFGNWVLSGTTAYTSTTCATGSQSFILSSGKSFSVSSLNSVKAYIVSFWASSSGISVSGNATQIKSAPTVNGFTYYEYSVPSGNSSITVSGTGTIDELRCYPQNARMRTVTYDPVIGKTSECDENNRITYYEYDRVGRLQFIKDYNRNILKSYEYNNISESRQNGCPGIYYNKLIKEVFIKNNCGSGYQGTEVVFSIPANTYSSTLSQEDADAQAENYILVNGQNYANSNGSCLLLYCNAAYSDTVWTQICAENQYGGWIIYTVPAGRYCSTESQAVVDTLAMDDWDENAQAYANDPLNAICNTDLNPHWVWLEQDSLITWCEYVNGTLHRFIRQTDINPSSSSYNSTRAFDSGPDSTCTAATCNNQTCSSTQGYKCVYGQCELGVQVYTTQSFDGVYYTCVYHYEFSDGSWSGNYTTVQTIPCYQGL